MSSFPAEYRPTKGLCYYGRMSKQALGFVVKSSVIYTLVYLVVGAVAYQLITKQFYVGDDPIFTAYLRSEANPDEWAHTNLWLIPGLLLRAILISLVLLPCREVLRNMTFLKRVGVLFGLMFVLIHLASAAPSPGNIEGLVYMKPGLTGVQSFLLTQPEMILQCILFALGLSWVIKKPSKRNG
jgi:hypothetical protein